MNTQLALNTLHRDWYSFCVDKSLSYPDKSVEHLWWWSLRSLMPETDFFGYWQYKVQWHMERYKIGKSFGKTPPRGKRKHR